MSQRTLIHAVWGLSIISVLILTSAQVTEGKLIARKSILQAESVLALVEKDLSRLSGFDGLGFGESGILELDPNELSSTGSATFRTFLLNMAEDQEHWFYIRDNSDSPEVHFARTDSGTVDLETGITYFEIEIDFKDFDKCKANSSKKALNAFSVGLNLFHEIDHKVSYDADFPIPSNGFRPDVRDGEIPGVIERTNLIREELEMAVREPGQHKGDVYKGPVRAFRGTATIQFRDADDKRLVIRWKLDQRR